MMNKQICQICLSEKRKIKFISAGRVSICQWCISDLSRERISRAESEKKIQELAFSIIEHPPLPVALPTYSNEELINIAKREVIEQIGEKPLCPQNNFNENTERYRAIDKIKSTENIIATIFKSIFFSTNREQQINSLIEIERQKYNQEYQNNLIKYVKEKEAYNLLLNTKITITLGEKSKNKKKLLNSTTKK